MGIVSNILGGGDSPQANAPLTLAEVEKIITDYRSMLESKHTPMCAADVKRLPYPKDRIKEALIIGMKATTDPDYKELLKMAYITLADWQEGVRDRRLELGPSDIDTNADPEEMLNKVLAQNTYFERWLPIIKADLEALEKELVDLGLWKSIIIESTPIDEARRSSTHK